MTVGPWSTGITLVAAGALLAYLEVAVAARALAACDVGSSAGTGFALSVSLVVLIAGHTLLVVTAVAVHRRSRRTDALGSVLVRRLVNV